MSALSEVRFRRKPQPAPGGAGYIGADLKDMDLSELPKEACLRGANVTGAIFYDLDVTGMDFRDTQGLIASQLTKVRNIDKALFSNPQIIKDVEHLQHLQQPSSVLKPHLSEVPLIAKLGFDHEKFAQLASAEVLRGVVTAKTLAETRKLAATPTAEVKIPEPSTKVAVPELEGAQPHSKVKSAEINQPTQQAQIGF